MKHLFLLLFLLGGKIVFSQTKIELDTVLGRKVMGKHHEFYIDSIVDKRIIQTNIGTTIKGGASASLHFSDDNAVNYLKKFFDKALPKGEGKTPIYAELNYFLLGNYVFDGGVNDGFVYLDIDFYQKNEQGTLIPVSHYHGSVINDYGIKVNKFHPERTYLAFKWAFRALDRKKMNTGFRDSIPYTDTTYVPQKGLYVNIMDYRHNSPLITQQKYWIRERTFHENSLAITLSDSLEQKYLGYSDGKDFYIARGNNTYDKVETKGRYLYLMKEASNFSGTTLIIPGGGAIGGAIGAAASIAATSHLPSVKNVVIDVATGRVFPLDDKNISEDIPKEDYHYKTFLARPNTINAMQLVNRINRIYHGSTLKAK